MAWMGTAIASSNRAMTMVDVADMPGRILGSMRRALGSMSKVTTTSKLVTWFCVPAPWMVAEWATLETRPSNTVSRMAST